MADWKQVAVGVGIGGAAGAVDQLAQSQDEKRALDYAVANPGKTLSHWKQYGTYVNFLAPIVGVALIATGYVRGDNVDKVAIVSGQLAGRKLVHRFVKLTGAPVSPAPYQAWQRARAAEQSAAQITHQAATRTLNPEFDGAGIV